LNAEPDERTEGLTMSNLPARIAVMAAGILAALIGVGAACIFLSVALYAALCLLMSPPLAALAAAGLFLLLSLIVLAAAGGIVGALKKQNRQNVRPSTNFLGAELGRMLGEDAQSYIAKKPWTAVVLAVAGGFVIGLSPRLREALLRVLKG
jgi:hypothetical protein